MSTISGLFTSIPFDSTYVLLGIIIAFIGIHFYSLSREKKELLQVVDNKVKVFQKAFDISEDAMLILSDDNKIVYANRVMQKLLDLPKDFMFKSLPKMPQIKIKTDWVTLDRLITSEYKRADEKMLSYLQTSLLVDELDDSEGIPVNLYVDSSLLGSKHDMWCNIISIHDLRQKKKEKTLGSRHQLTALPNQIQLLHDLNALYAKVHLNKQKLALVIIDIDDFSTLRSIIGYDQINIILIKFAQYLESIATRLDISVYHTYYNNFVISISNLSNQEEILSFVKDIQKQLASFYKMQDVKLYLTASVGISMYPDSGSTRGLLDKAYKALSQAQGYGDGRIQIYEAEDLVHDYDELLLHNEMHEAIEKNQFEVYYQPIIDSYEKEVVSAEALIRWNHPKYGLIAPYIFIPIMEKTGFIVELGRFVLEEVLKQQKRWELFKFKKIDVSINITLFEIEAKDFVENVAKQIQHHQVNPSLIKFEITEGSAMISEESTQKQFWNLKKLGVGISLDDFGTGYTSFVYLKRFPADILKIDKTLIDYILTNKEDQRIVKAMIELGHNLGMKVVAEGIENERMSELLMSYGCDLLQGYYYGKPLPVFEFQKLLR
ncbi:MAG TPA: bifunctional diguanylate cyclase/phosphodiesterase [Epsilonproteobacteria bacterium]|nr:bifunctional diguanylate cyclase/phosphodiesterase [Campylobacterota bacterium]